MRTVTSAPRSPSRATRSSPAPRSQTERSIDQGAAYVFVKPAGGWANATQTAKLTASDGRLQRIRRLGRDLGRHDRRRRSGEQTSPGRTRQGAAYVFVKPAGGWANGTQTAKLTASEARTTGSVVGRDLRRHDRRRRPRRNGFLVEQGAAYVFVEAGGRLGERDADGEADRLRRRITLPRPFGRDLRRHGRRRCPGRTCSATLAGGRSMSS